ncbi:hypothetical protein D018_2999A, partial [Vibrio parahaemolyticus VP2007-007]
MLRKRRLGKPQKRLLT